MGISIGKFGLKKVPLSIILVSSLAELLENWCHDDQCRTNCCSSLVCNSWPKKCTESFVQFFSSFLLAFAPSLRKIMDSLTANFSFSLVHALLLSRPNMAVKANQHLKAKVIIFRNHQLKNNIHMYFWCDTCLEENFYPLIIEDLQFIFSTKLLG